MIVPRPSPGPEVGLGFLDTLLGSGRQRFWSHHYGQRPYVSRGVASTLLHLVDDASLDHLIDATTCELTAIRDGRLHAGTRPESRGDANRLLAEGYSLVFRHVERHAAAIAQVGQALTDDLHGRLDVHVYHTPPGHFSFGWHFDAEEVFFVHLGGVKEFLLRQNTVHVAPLPETMPRNLHFEREVSPVLCCRLKPGDCLYIPSGWWHHAVAETMSRSLSFGLMPLTALDVLTIVRHQVRNLPQWRQRLPARGNAVAHLHSESVARTHALLTSLTAEMIDHWHAVVSSLSVKEHVSSDPEVNCVIRR